MSTRGADASSSESRKADDRGSHDGLEVAGWRIEPVLARFQLSPWAGRAGSRRNRPRMKT